MKTTINLLFLFLCFCVAHAQTSVIKVPDVPNNTFTNVKNKTIESDASTIEKELIVSVYPNPTPSYIKIVSKDKVDSVYLVNAKGEKVLETKQIENPISIKHLDTGFYLMFIKSNKGYVVRKIIKKINDFAN